MGCGEGSPASSKASVTSQVKACTLRPFEIGHSSVLPGDPPLRAGHSGTREVKQEGAREDAASASGGKCSLPAAAAKGRVGTLGSR